MKKDESDQNPKRQGVRYEGSNFIGYGNKAHENGKFICFQIGKAGISVIGRTEQQSEESRGTKSDAKVADYASFPRERSRLFPLMR